MVWRASVARHQRDWTTRRVETEAMRTENGMWHLRMMCGTAHRTATGGWIYPFLLLSPTPEIIKEGM